MNVYWRFLVFRRLKGNKRNCLIVLSIKLSRHEGNLCAAYRICSSWTGCCWKLWHSLLLSLTRCFLSGWSAALGTPRCASGILRPVSVYTSSWATWRRCAASSTMAGGWSAVPTTSWSKCGTLRRRPASTRCRATPTECTHYRWGCLSSHTGKRWCSAGGQSHLPHFHVRLGFSGLTKTCVFTCLCSVRSLHT